MNKNGEKTKLLAAVAVLAMIMCVFAIVVPASDAAAISGDEFLALDENDDGVIDLNADVTVSSVITVTGALTINGNGHTITADSTATWNGDGDKNILSIENVGATVTINNVTLDSDNAAYGLNIDSSSDIENNNVVLNDVIVKNSKGAGLTVNDNSNAEVNESSFSKNGWGDINVDNASTLNIDDATELTSNFQIWSEDVTAQENPSVINADSYVGYRWDKTGTDVVTDGRAYFKNGNTAGDLTLASGESLTVIEDDYLFVAGEVKGGGSVKGVYFNIPAGVTATANGNVITVSGTAIADSAAMPEGSSFTDVFTAHATGYAYMQINGLTVADNTIITQTNPALSIYPENEIVKVTIDGKEVPEIQKVGNDYVKAKPYSQTNVDSGYAFLVSNGDEVTVKIGDKTIYTFNFSGVETGATATDADSANEALKNDNVSEVTIDGSKLTSSATPIVVPADKTLVIENPTNGSEFTINTVDGDKTQSAKFDGVTGTIVITKGSVVMYSPDMVKGGVVTVGAGTTLRIADGTSIDGVKFVGTDDKSIVEVPRSATVTFANTITFEGVAANLKGTVTGGTITAGEGSTVTLSGTIDSMVTNTGGKIVNNAASLGEIELKDGTTIVNKSSVDGFIGQDIVVSGDVTVANGGYINVNGTLTIAADATLTLEQGSKLNVGAAGNVVVDGTIAVAADAENDKGTVFTYLGGSMIVNGAVTLEGKDAFATSDAAGAKGTGIVVNGDFTVGEDSDAAIDGLTVAATGELLVNGVVSGEFTNNGTVTIDTEAVAAKTAAATINMGDGATLNLVNALGAYTVTDVEMEYAYNGSDYSILNGTQVVFTNVAGVTVTDSLTTKMEPKSEGSVDTERHGYGNMTISGNADVASSADDDENITATIVVSDVASSAEKLINKATKGTLNVAAETSLNLSAFVQMTVDSGVFNVAGTVDASVTSKDSNNKGTIVVKGTMDVTGTVTTKDAIVNVDNVNAAHYTSGTGNDEVNIYTSLNAAIAAGADDIDLYGNYVISEDVTIPAGVDVDVDSAVKVTVEKDVTVTVAYDSATKDSGKLTNKTDVIYVEGTLVTENLKKSGVVKDNVDCDVIVEDGDYAMFTNIYAALDDATDGSTVTITRDNGPIDITESIVIPTGVTLIVPSESGLNLMPGVTVTVDGTIENDGSYTNDKSNEGLEESKKAKTVVNGMFKIQSSTDAYQDKIAGAYYYYDGYNCISPISVLSTVLADVESEDAKVYGTVTEGDVTLAKEDFTLATGNTKTKLTLTNLTLDGVVFDFQNGRTNATVTVADGSFVLVNAVGGKISSVSTVENDVETETATMTGDVKLAQAEATEKNLKGSVTVNGTADIVTATFEVPVTVSEGAVVGASDVDFGTVTVNGTLNVEGKNLETKAVAAYVYGTVTVAEDSAAVVNRLFIGIAVDYETGIFSDRAAGAVSGVKVGIAAFVSPTATFTAVDDQAENGKSELVSTEYYIEDALFLTAYAINDQAFPIIAVTASITDARFDGWMNADEVFATYDDNDTFTGIGSEGFDKVYADIEYEIYVINMKADTNAISSISIDGSLMQYGMIAEYGADGKTITGYYYGYTAVVSAGAHTIQYQLANGYSGNGILAVNGTQQSGLTFTTEGTPAVNQSNIEYNLQLTGFEKSGYVPDSPDTGDSGESDSGMTITDYLLIVLVVLIIVMAIIVAMRLMRS